MPETVHFRTTSSTRYLTLSEARALECNGCGDCCDSNRTDRLFEWGRLPKHQYRGTIDDNPLIIPLDIVTLEPREWEQGDDDIRTTVFFKCAAFCPNADGTGSCIAHENRPDRCRDFPIFGKDVRKTITREGRYYSPASLFSRCTWNDIIILKENSPILKIRDSEGRVDNEKITPKIREEIKQWKAKFDASGKPFGSKDWAG